MDRDDRVVVNVRNPDREFTRSIRESIDQISEYNFQDARKSSELPAMNAPSIRSSISDESYRRSMKFGSNDGRPLSTLVSDEHGGKSSLRQSIDRAKLEKHTLEEVEEEKEGHDDTNILRDFPISHGLTSTQAAALLEQFGRNELPEKITPKWLIFLSLLWQPMPIMIWVAAIVEIAIGNYPDMAILIMINMVNASLSFYETTKAGDAIAALKASLKPTAICMRDGKWNNLFDARLLVPGDLVELCSGGAVPADCMVNSGSIDVDESAMTGESLPVTLRERQMAKMGGTVVRGETHGTIVYTGKNTFYGKTAAMLGDSGDRSNLQILLLKIIIILCIMAFILVAAAFTYLFHWKGENLKVSASFAVVVIVASIPMGIEIVTTTTLAIGSKTLSNSGVIVSRLAAIDDLAGLNMLCSDKTGTLTKNKMTIQDDAPTYEPNLGQMDLLKQAALAAKWDSPPKDALDTLFLRCHLWDPTVTKELNAMVSKNPNMTQAEKDEFYNSRINAALQKSLSDYESLAFMPFDPRVKRTEGTIRQKSTGSIFKVTKGAPHILHKLDHDEHKGAQMDKKVVSLGEDGIRAVAIAVSEPINDQWRAGVKPEDQKINAVWHITGMLTFLDPPRDDTKETILRSQGYGVPVRMITGDHLLIAKKTCKDLDMGNMDRPGWPMIQGPEELPVLDAEGKPPKNLVENYGHHIQNADGFAQVFPEHKYLVVECFRQLGYKCGMTGDGVNDAPALKRADVGIAVAGATDAARASADIILTQEGLSTIILGMETARIIFARMKSFLTYRVAATLQLLTFFFIAVFAFQLEKYPHAPTDVQEWPRFFSLPVILLMLITLINDGTLISIGYDYCAPSKKPERWVLPILFIVSIALGAVACSSSLLLLWALLSSSEPHSFLSMLGVEQLKYGQIVSAMFLKVAITDILTLFSARTAHQFFFMRKPNPILFFCCLGALSLSTTIAVVLPCDKWMDDHSVPICGLYHDRSLIALYVWIYCIGVFFVQDVIKVITWRIIMGLNLFNVNNVVKNSADDERTRLLPGKRNNLN